MSSTVGRMVELTASGDADQVEARLREALDAHGLQLFARIDHAAGARKAGVELEPDVLLRCERAGRPWLRSGARRSGSMRASATTRSKASWRGVKGIDPGKTRREAHLLQPSPQLKPPW